MQASTSRAAVQSARILLVPCSVPSSRSLLANPAVASCCSYAAARRNASTASKTGKRKAKTSKTPAPPSPTALPFSEAIRTLKAFSAGDTTSAVDLVLLSKLAASVNINSLRGRTFLQHDASSAKKKDTIVVIAEGELADAARQEGADVVGGKELIDEIVTGRVQPTKLIAAPDQLQHITRSTLPRILGPKGLMPSAKRGTVTDEIARAVREARGGLDWLGMPIGPPKSTSKADSSDRGMVSVPIARATFTEDQIKQNLVQFAKQVKDVLNGVGTQAQVSSSGAGAAGRKKLGQIEKAYLSTSKTFSIEVTDIQQIVA